MRDERLSKAGDLLVQALIILLQNVVLVLQLLHLVLFSHAGHVGGVSVALHAFVFALCFLLLCFGTFPGWKVGGGLGKDLTPGLSLLLGRLSTVCQRLRGGA